MKNRLPFLSSAILLEKPASQAPDSPSILALQECGALPSDLEDCRSYGIGHYTNLACPGEEFVRLYSWLRETLLCPWRACQMMGAEIVEHPFDDHVRSREISREEQSEWIEEMEDDDEPDQGSEHYARAVYFQDCYEWEGYWKRPVLTASQ
jgi:hypothetical protein